MPYFVHHLVEQFVGVGDHEESAFVFLQEFAQPQYGIGIQMVRRFVQDECVGIGEEDACQFYAPALSAGERAELLAHDLLG